jgi:transcriptional regulator with XRE-family HTH domain
VTPITTKNIAQKIKELRQARGLTLEQIASVVGVGKSTVRKWETGMITNMKSDKIADLAKVLCTTPAYLMGWEDATKKTEQAIDNTLMSLLADLTEEERIKVVAYIKGLKANRKH